MSTKPARFDLHLHTWWSYDALNNPEDYFGRAVELGLRCIAITDHHHVDSKEEVDALRGRYPQVRFVRGAELSVKTRFGSWDLLCFNLPDQPTGALAEALNYSLWWLKESAAALIRGMTALGFPFGEAELQDLLQRYRPKHVCERQGIVLPAYTRRIGYFMERGWVADQAAYVDLVTKNADLFRFPSYQPIERVVPAVKEAGGVVVLAHPARYLGDDLEKLDVVRQEFGLDGLECAHPTVSPELTALYRDYCLKHGMISTGGSDSHGPATFETPQEWGYNRKPTFGSHLGEERWLDEFLERLDG